MQNENKPPTIKPKLSLSQKRKMKAAILDQIIFPGSTTLNTFDMPGSVLRFQVKQNEDGTATITILPK